MERNLSWLNQPYQLTEELAFKLWQDETQYTKCYYVSPEGCDSADGSLENPFRTVKRASELVQPGEKVILRGGVYQETIRPLRGGQGKNAMIAYEAYPGEYVQVSGLRAYRGGYESGDLWRSLHGKKNVFRLRVTDYIENDYNAFAINKMPHSWGWIDYNINKLRHHELPRGQVLVDGERLPQAKDMTELATMEKGVWTETCGRYVNILWPDETLPQRRVELVAAEELFAPADYFTGYIAVRGIHFHGCANGYPVPQNGAFTTNRGHHFIVEDCRFSLVNGIALDIGRHSWHSQPCPTDGHLIRRNHFSDIGVCGIAGYGAEDALIEENILENVCRDPVEFMAENAAIKLHEAHRSLLRRNRISNTPYGQGIWMDCFNWDSRLCENVLFNIVSDNGGLMYEANRGPAVVDNNLVVGCTSLSGAKAAGGFGVNLHGSEECGVYRNFLWDCKGSALFINAVGNRMVGTRVGLGRKNVIRENIFGGTGRALVEIPHEDNAFEDNLYARKGMGGYIRIGTADNPYTEEAVNLVNIRLDLPAFQKFFERDRSGRLSDMDARFDPDTCRLSVTCGAQDLPALQAIIAFRDAEVEKLDERYLLTITL